EDGIRVFHVTGVQTCALPISPGTPVRDDRSSGDPSPAGCGPGRSSARGSAGNAGLPGGRSTPGRSTVSWSLVEWKKRRQRMLYEIGRASCRERWEVLEEKAML